MPAAARCDGTSNELELEGFGRASGPSVVEGGFAVDCRDGDDAAVLDGRLEALGRSKRIKRQVLGATRYALKRGIQSRCSWLPKSVRHCGSKRPGSAVKIARSGSGHPVWLGVNRCGDPRACPTCSAAVTAQRRDELLLLFERARDEGWSAMSATLTLRHGLGDDGAQLAELLSLAYRKTFERAGMRKALKGLGFQGSVRIAETNYSWLEGYHPHLHVVLIFDQECGELEAMVLRSILAQQWQQAVADASAKVGIDCGLPDLEHGVDLEALDLARGPEYFVKVGLVAELLGQFTKTGRRAASRTMWEVARDMVMNDRLGLSERAADDEGVWQGYVTAMRHFKGYFVSRRLRAKLLAPLQLDLELGNVVTTDVTELYTFTDAEYATVQRAGPLAFAALEALVEEGKPPEAIGDYLRRLEEHLADVDDRRAGRAPVPFTVTGPLAVTTWQLDDQLSIFGAQPRTLAMVRGQDTLALFDRLLAAA
jgi:hypothetical protein